MTYFELIGDTIYTSYKLLMEAIKNLTFLLDNSTIEINSFPQKNKILYTLNCVINKLIKL